MKKMIFFLILILLSFFCFASEEEKKIPNQALGITSSFGLSYQQWFNNGMGFQLAGYINTPDDYIRFTSYLELQKKLHTIYNKNNTVVLFAWLGTGCMKQFYTDDISGTFPILAGLGFGFDFICFEHLSFPVKLGYFGKVTKDIEIDFYLNYGIQYRF